MQAGPVQDLIRIDVADPGDELLMHKQGLEAPAPARHHRPEVLPGHRQRIAPEPPRGKARQARPVEQVDPTEPSGVPVIQRWDRAGQRKGEVGMLPVRGIEQGEEQEAGHAELEE